MFKLAKRKEVVRKGCYYSDLQRDADCMFGVRFDYAKKSFDLGPVANLNPILSSIFRAILNETGNLETAAYAVCNVDEVATELGYDPKLSSQEPEWFLYDYFIHLSLDLNEVEGGVKHA